MKFSKGVKNEVGKNVKKCSEAEKCRSRGTSFSSREWKWNHRKKKEYEVEKLVNKRILKGKVSLLQALGSWGRSPAFFARRQLLRAWNRLG